MSTQPSSAGNKPFYRSFLSEKDNRRVTLNISRSSAPLVPQDNSESRRNLQKEAELCTQKEFEDLRKEIKSLKNIVEDLRSDNEHLRTRVDSLEYGSKHTTKKSPEARKDGQVLSSEDLLSISNLAHMVQTLNREIHAASHSLGDTMLRREPTSLPPEEDMKRYIAHSKNLLGPLSEIMLHESMGKTDEPVHPLLVNVILQTLLVNFCAKKIHTWTPQESHNQFLDTLYHEIRSSSDQAVSGRWRALTRAQLEPGVQSWLAELTADLHGVLMAASWEVKSSEDVRSFESRLQVIFKTILDVRSAIGEKVISSDIEPNVVQPGSLYPGNGPDGHLETVIGTTEMGLYSVVPSAGRNGTLVCTDILPPQIVLERTLRAALNLPPPSKQPENQDGRAD